MQSTFGAGSSNSALLLTHRYSFNTNMIAKPMPTDAMDSPPDLRRTIKIAAAQLSPVWLDKQATTDKVCRMILEAGQQGAEVIGFPECIIPGYGAWNELIPMDRPKAHGLFQELFLNSVEVPGPETERIAEACKAAGCYAVVGINERLPGSTGTTFNTQLIFGKDGKLLNKHQKYVPTLGERYLHTAGRTGSASSAKTEFGCLSGLVCGENANALAIYSLSLEYPTIHVASWPSHFTPEIEMDTCILNSTRGAAYSLRTFLINSIAVIDDEAIEACAENEADREFLRREQQKSRSTILGPDGNTIAGPLGPGDGILYADVCPADTIVSKYAIDIAGHYNRPEVFAHHFAQYFEGGASRRA